MPPTSILRWTPARGASEASPYDIEFVVADSQYESRSFGTIVVRPQPLAISDVFPERIPQAGGIPMSIRGVGFTSPATVRIGGRLGTDVVVNDSRSIQFTAPDVSDLFGPQLVSIVFEDGESTSTTGVFVYRDQTDLRNGLHRVSLPESSRAWAVADLEGDTRGELLVATPDGLWWVDPHGDADPIQLVRRGQGGVTAQVDLESRCEPAQLERVAARDEERRFREVVLSRDGQQGLIVEPLLQRADGCRVT